MCRMNRMDTTHLISSCCYSSTWSCERGRWDPGTQWEFAFDDERVAGSVAIADVISPRGHFIREALLKILWLAMEAIASLVQSR